MIRGHEIIGCRNSQRAAIEVRAANPEQPTDPQDAGHLAQPDRFVEGVPVAAEECSSLCDRQELTMSGPRRGNRWSCGNG